MAVFGAPKELQPWLTQTDSRLEVAEANLLSVQQGLAQIPQMDKSVFTTLPIQDFPTHGSAAQVMYPANNTVKYSNSTGLMEVTVTGSIRTIAGGIAAIGFFYDALTPQVVNGIPTYGLSDFGISNTAYSRFGSSYTFMVSVRPGIYTCGLYYFSDNTWNASLSEGYIDYAQLIVRSV